MNISANIISILHLLFVIFVVSTPFITDNAFLLLYYCFIISCVIAHWKLNNDTCVLTLIESKLRGKKDKYTFMGRLIKPIYNVTSREVQLTTLALFLYAFFKIRVWDENRRNYICNIIYLKYRVLSNLFFPLEKSIDSDNTYYSNTEYTDSEYTNTEYSNTEYSNTEN
jgi:hypothetical protein